MQNYNGACGSVLVLNMCMHINAEFIVILCLKYTVHHSLSKQSYRTALCVRQDLWYDDFDTHCMLRM
jgi:hypothetical protein